MDNSEATIHCSNPNCQASNLWNHKHCLQCGTPISKRYLWITADLDNNYHIGDLIDDRYLVIERRIVVDTQPAQPPQVPEEIPVSIATYLQLYSLRLNIPQVYGKLKTGEDLSKGDLWLLEYESIPTNSSGELENPQLFPKLDQIWHQAKALRQLNWLWQIAKLWQPLSAKRVASTLINPSSVAVNGAIVQILELQSDQDSPPSLKQLGQLWSKWTIKASDKIKEFLEQLCLHLEQEIIVQPENLLALLEQAIDRYRRSQQYHYQIFTETDSGPSRKHNEDSCYPNSGKMVTINSPEKPLAIVCDGIGGHEGGEIASQAAIESLQQSVASIIFDSEDYNPAITQKKLANFTSIANDIISERNDREQRHERQRMGTTLVMAVGNGHEMYLTHVGDSRIYWITSNGCHQMTVDDDLASREVRMGYTVYREATQYPSAGALIQALGMRESNGLHPNIQRVVVDEDCVFLLCSDGLSDFDRVEQYWRNTIIPVLDRKSNLDKAAKELIKIANEKNGHDNVTVALVYCQVNPKPGIVEPTLIWSEIQKAADLYTVCSQDEYFSTTMKMPTVQANGNVQVASPTTLIHRIPNENSESMPTLDPVTTPKKSFPWFLWSILGLFVVSILGSFCYTSFFLPKQIKPPRNDEGKPPVVEEQPNKPLNRTSSREKTKFDRSRETLPEDPESQNLDTNSRKKSDHSQNRNSTDKNQNSNQSDQKESPNNSRQNTDDSSEKLELPQNNSNESRPSL